MRHNKYSFGIGLGIGIIVGAVLLQLVLIAANNHEKYRGNYAAQEKQYSQEEVDQLIAAAQNSGEQSILPEDNTQASATTPLPSSSAKPPSTPIVEAPDTPGDPTLKPAATATAPEQPSIPEIKQTIVRIPPGATLTDAGELLVSQGLIEDSGAFVTRMSALNKLVRAGYFSFEQTQHTIEEAIEIVTASPVDPNKIQNFEE